MKDELQGKLVEILSTIQGAAGKASDFALSQLPDIAQSYIAYGRAYTAVALVAAVLFCVYAVWAIRKSVADDTPYGQEPLYGISGLAAAIVGFITLAINANAAFLVWFAPKVWLLKEIAGMVR